jgi:5S rRNA maturation endonuclease (ribonuclease M5)
MIDKRERVYQAFGAFLSEFAKDLNHKAESGWCLLVEGPRDSKAMRKLGYHGDLATISAVGRSGTGILGAGMKVIILTDLDREGALLASRFVSRLDHEGFRTSLSERRRLKAASRGVFLHVENLSRFGESDE